MVRKVEGELDTYLVILVWVQVLDLRGVVIVVENLEGLIVNNEEHLEAYKNTTLCQGS